MATPISCNMLRIKHLAATLFSLLLVQTALASPDLPQIPDRTVSVMDYGAVADGITLNTQAFEKAVSALSKQGGGHLVVPEGLYLTGPIALKDAIDLHLERGAVILLSPDKTLHLKDGSVKPGISASKRHDVSITGEGIIDGNGQWWRGVKRSKVSDVEWKYYRRMGGTVTPDGKVWYPFGLKNLPDIADDAAAQEKKRTHLVRFTDCTRVAVQGVTLQNSPKFHLVPQRCKHVTIDGVTVRCPWNAQNGDGIDLMNCQEVLIAHCLVDVGDDGICLKAGAGEKGAKDGPCRNVIIEHNTVFHAHGGFVVGSEFSGGMENITVRHNTFMGTDTGLRFKSAPERGGVTGGIRISDIVMTDIQTDAIVFQTTYADRPVGREDNQAAATENYLPEFTDIVIERITCNGALTAIRAEGTPSTIHDVLIRDSVFLFYGEDQVLSAPGLITLQDVRLVPFPCPTPHSKTPSSPQAGPEGVEQSVSNVAYSRVRP